MIRAREQPWFGWGGFGRNRVRDRATGQDISVTDGAWIIVLGTRGSVGLVGYLGLLLFPVLYAWRRRRWVSDPTDRAMVSTLALVVVVYALDEIPNSAGALPLHFLAGALMGALQGAGLQRRRAATSKAGGLPS